MRKSSTPTRSRTRRKSSPRPKPKSKGKRKSSSRKITVDVPDYLIKYWKYSETIISILALVFIVICVIIALLINIK